MYSSYLIALAAAVAAPGLRVPSVLRRLSFGRAALPAAGTACSLLVLTFAYQQHLLYEVARGLRPTAPILYRIPWIAIWKGAVAFGHSLWGKLVALRLIQLGALALCALAFIGMRVPFAAVAIFAVNPMLYEQYVASAHNDALAVAFVLLASLASRRWLPAAVVLVVAAAAIKLPLAAIGVLAFTTQPSLRRRAAAMLWAWLLTIAVYVASASQYLRALEGTMHAYRPPVAPAGSRAACHARDPRARCRRGRGRGARGRTFAGFLRSFVSLAEFESSWYLAWALPYAAIRPKLLTIYLLSLPLAAYELANQYTQTSLYIVIRDGLFVALLAAFARRLCSRVRVRAGAIPVTIQPSG